jgi:hypothetical protein
LLDVVNTKNIQTPSFSQEESTSLNPTLNQRPHACTHHHVLTLTAFLILHHVQAESRGWRKRGLTVVSRHLTSARRNLVEEALRPCLSFMSLANSKETRVSIIEHRDINKRKSDVLANIL